MELRSQRAAASATSRNYVPDFEASQADVLMKAVHSNVVGKHCDELDSQWHLDESLLF